MKKLLPILSILFLMQNVSFAAIYYVSTTGSNSNDGLTTGTTWLTIQYAIDQAGPGDEVQVVAGVYNELVEFNNSGNSAQGSIFLKNYQNDRPIIDATGLANSYDGMISILKIEDKNYIEVSGFEIRNLITSSPNKFPSGVWVLGDAHDIVLNDNVIHDIQHNDMEGAHGIGIYGTKSTGSIYNISITNNEIYDCVLAYSETLVLNGNVRDFEVNYNIVHDNNNIGIDFIGHEGTCPDPSQDQARDGVCIGNLVYNIDTRSNPAYGGEASAAGIYIDGGKNILVEQNEIFQTNLGIELASEWIGKTTSEIDVRNNFVYNCHVVGLAIGGYDNLRGETRDCNIVNNTFYGNDTDNVGWGSEVLVQYYCYDNVVKNNIFHAKNNGIQIAYWNDTGSNNDFDNNTYYNSGSVEYSWAGIYYPSFSSMSAATGQEGNGFFQSPLLVDPDNGDIRLTSNSPCVDAGIDLGTTIVGLEDFDGNARIEGSNIDIGAHEFTTISSNHIGVNSNCIEIFPNPFTNKVVMEGDFNDYNIEILDASGNLVLDLTGSSSPIEVNLDDLGNGIYFVRLESMIYPEHFVEKIIKN